MADEGTKFDVSAELRGGATVIAVRGELDMASHDRLSEQLSASAAEGPVVVDMSECEFIDSSGIRALLLGVRAREGSGEGGFVLAAVNPQVRRTLEVTGLGETLPVHESVEAALDSLGSD